MRRKKWKRIDVSDVVVDPSEIEAAFERPRDAILWSNHPADEDPEHWVLGPMLRTRDSGLMAESNYEMLLKYLDEDKTIRDDWQITRLGHWGPGWVEYLSYRALNKDGTPSKMFKVVKKWFDALADYPLADEEDHSRREYEATLSNICDAGRRYLADDVPDGWEAQVFSWFWDHDQRAVEPHDDQGGYPDDEQIKKALIALDYIDADSACDKSEYLVGRFVFLFEKLREALGALSRQRWAKAIKFAERGDKSNVLVALYMMRDFLDDSAVVMYEDYGAKAKRLREDIVAWLEDNDEED